MRWSTKEEEMAELSMVNRQRRLKHVSPWIILLRRLGSLRVSQRVDQRVKRVMREETKKETQKANSKR
jgi:hypothetical protein